MIYLCCLRFLREFEKWSEVEKIRKNRGKLGKKLVLESPFIHYFDENSRKFSKRVENTVGKGEIARYEQFLLFPQCFQKTCTADTEKTQGLFGKGLTQSISHDVT